VVVNTARKQLRDLHAPADSARGNDRRMDAPLARISYTCRCEPVASCYTLFVNALIHSCRYCELVASVLSRGAYVDY
jgi:hypothetical protein